MTFSSSKRSTATTTTTTFVLLLLSLVHVLALSFLVSPRRYSSTAKMVVFASAAKPPTTTTREAEEKNEKNAWHVSISVLGGGRNSRGKKKEEEEEDVEARNGGFSRVRHESTLKAVLALATKRNDDETDENLVRREEEEEEEEETEKTLSARFSAEDFARKRDVILISVCSSGVGGGEEGSFVSSSFSSPSPTRSWSASSTMYEFAAKGKASSSCGGSESVSMQCNRAEFLDMDGGGKREKADAYERAMVSETGVKSRDVLVSSALRRLSEELACFSERSAERFGEGKVSSSRDTSEIEVAYAEICGIAALDGLDATERKKIERFVEKKIEDVLERVGALGVMVVAQAREVNEIVESQRKRRALLQENDSSEDGRSAKEYPNKAAATIVGFILLLGAVAGFLAMLTMPFPTDSLLFPKTKGE
jgi:hypothetical protein